MPPGRWLKMPACAKPYAIAIDPTAVTSHDSSEIAPTWAMLAGSMMMPDPIMFTVTMNVSCTTPIFFCASAILSLLVSLPARSFADDVGVELDAPVHLFLVDALYFVVEPGKAVERLLEGEEVVEHRSCPFVPAFARQHHADAGRIDQRQRGRNAALDVFERNVVDLVGDECLVGVLRRHRQFGEARRAKAQALQFLDVGVAIELVHLVADLPQRVARIALAVRRVQRRQHLVQRRVPF